MSTEQDTFPVSAAEMKKKNMFYHSITDMMAVVHQRLRANFDFNSGCDIIALPTKVVVACKNVYETKHCLTSIIQNVNINGVIYWPRQLFYDDKLHYLEIPRKKTGDHQFKISKGVHHVTIKPELLSIFHKDGTEVTYYEYDVRPL